MESLVASLRTLAPPPAEAAAEEEPIVDPDRVVPTAPLSPPRAPRPEPELPDINPSMRIEYPVFVSRRVPRDTNRTQTT